jgi:hypothetical protein
MIKRYNDFISESVNQRVFNSDYDEFMSIYNTKITPKLGEVKEVTNFMLDGVLTKSEQNNFNYHKAKLKDYRDDFSDSISSLDRFYGSSFSRLASSNHNPDEDFEEMQKMLNRAGFTLDVIGKLFNPAVSVFLHQDFNNFVESGLDDKSGYIDMYLYKLNEKFNLNTTVWLGGDGWGDALDEQPEEEYMVKYAYGYHKTKYGQMFLEQMKLSKEDFVDRAYEYLKDYLNENVYSRIYSDIKKMAQIGYASQITEIKLNIDDYIIIDDDRFIIRYLEMCDDFNAETDNKYENSADPDWFKETILSNIRVLSHLNIQDTGDELIFND